jgi:hypothetical protein
MDKVVTVWDGNGSLVCMRVRNGDVDDGWVEDVTLMDLFGWLGL